MHTILLTVFPHEKVTHNERHTGTYAIDTDIIVHAKVDSLAAPDPKQLSIGQHEASIIEDCQCFQGSRVEDRSGRFAVFRLSHRLNFLHPMATKTSVIKYESSSENPRGKAGWTSLFFFQ